MVRLWIFPEEQFSSTNYTSKCSCPMISIPLRKLFYSKTIQVVCIKTVWSQQIRNHLNFHKQRMVSCGTVYSHLKEMFPYAYTEICSRYTKPEKYSLCCIPSTKKDAWHTISTQHVFWLNNPINGINYSGNNLSTVIYRG